MVGLPFVIECLIDVTNVFLLTLKYVNHIMRRGRSYLCNLIEFKKTISL